MRGPIPDLADSLVELIGFLMDRVRDQRLLSEAGLDIDPALMPLIVRLGLSGPAGAVELGDRFGRDHSTVSRQLARLAAAGLIERIPSDEDRRLRPARLTALGEGAFAALAQARVRLLSHALADWSDTDREDLARLLDRLNAALTAGEPGHR